MSIPLQRYTLTSFDQRPLYFLHIPKTAGTTFISVLESQFEADQICPAYLWHDLINIPASQLSRYRLFRGHFYYYLYRILPRFPIYITMLRDPLERTISHYEHIYRDPNHYWHQRVKNQSLLNFIRDPQVNPMVSNFQTRSIALDLDPRMIAASLNGAALQALLLEKTLESSLPNNITDESLLRIAKSRLDQFAFVGITERFHESMLLLSNLFGWPPVSYIESRNRAPTRLQVDELSAETRDAALEILALDIELYRYAQRRFQSLLLKGPTCLPQAD